MKQIGDLVYSFLHVSQFKETQTSFKLAFDAFTESTKSYHEENDLCWKKQDDYNSELEKTYDTLRQSIDGRFDEHKKQSNTLSESLVNTSNRIKQAQKQLEEHHKVHQTLTGKVEGAVHQMVELKTSVEDQLKKRFELMDINVKGLEESIEKLNYETSDKFEVVDRNISEAIDSVKQDVKIIL